AGFRDRGAPPIDFSRNRSGGVVDGRGGSTPVARRAAFTGIIWSSRQSTGRIVPLHFQMLRRAGRCNNPCDMADTRSIVTGASIALALVCAGWAVYESKHKAAPGGFAGAQQGRPNA